jgi:hypothetical protein
VAALAGFVEPSIINGMASSTTEIETTSFAKALHVEIARAAIEDSNSFENHRQTTAP